MNSLKTLGAFVVGAIIIAVSYGIAFGGKDTSVNFEFDDGEGVRHVVNGDRGKFILREDDLTIEASWRGDYELNADGSDVSRLERRLEITRKQNGATERAVFENDDEDVERSFYRDGAEQDDGAETDNAVRELLLVFLRASGVKADERVAILMRKGGADAVLEEMTALHGDHARQRYISTLTESAELEPQQLRKLVDIASGMKGDNNIRRALEAIIEHEEISEDVWPSLIAAADKIESDYDLRRLIETVAEQDINAEAVRLALGLFDRIDSDHDLRRAGEALLEQEALTAEGAAALLSAAAARIDSDHDLRLLLSEAAAHMTSSDAVADAWLEGFSSLGSDHDKRLALEEAAEIDALSDAIVMKLLDATHEIGSDHDHRLALALFAERAGKNPELRAAYLSSAQAISSDHDRRQALQAVGETSGE